MELLACSTMTFHITRFVVSCSGVLSYWSLSKNHFQGHIDHWEPHEINCLITPIGKLWFMWEVQYVSMACYSKKGYKDACTIMTSYLSSIFLIHGF